ncbi:MAG: nucleotide disphospho-sugar-binding domain-containing protein, partial [Bosea sp. (in: a-proteobacteria)]
VQDCMIGTGATQNIHHLYVLPHIEAASLDIHALSAEADLLISNQIIIGASSIAAKAGIPWMMAVVSPMALEMTVFKPGHAALPWMIDSNAVLDPLKPIYVQARARLNRQLGLADDARLPLPTRILCLFPKALARQNPEYDFTPIALGAAFDGETPPLDGSLAEFVHRPAKFPGKSPGKLAVMSLGSTVANGVGASMHEAFIAACAACGARGVVLAGARHADALRHHAGERVFIADHAPHAALFPHADVVVHHGGVGTMLEVLRAGKPSLVLPFAHDQPWNALFLHERGLGMAIAPADWREDTIRAALASLLDDPGWADRARAAAPDYSAEDGVAAGASFVHGWLQSQR